MAYIYKWIEGENELYQFCKERFNETPQFCKHHGFCAQVKIIKCEKEKPNGYYSLFFLLYMQSDKGNIYDIEDIRTMTYEQIRADRTAILK